MGRVSEQQFAFNGGEFSPLMYGRQDVDKYKTALAFSMNGVLLAQGPWTRRSGTLRLNQTRDGNANKKSYLFPFNFSVTQAYMLEFGDLYIRFYSGHGLITQTPNVLTAATRANPCVVTYTGVDPANGDRMFIQGVIGMTQLNNREFTVANVNAGAKTFELSGVNSTNYGAYASGGTAANILNLTSGYAVADLPALRVLQSADVLYLLHAKYKPQKLIRTSALSWSLVNIGFLDGPYGSLNATTTTLTPSAFAPGAGVTLTASSVVGINGDQGFLATDVGRLIRIKQGTTWGYVQVTGFTSTTVVTVTIVNTLTDVTAKVNWKLGLWSDTTGYPGTGCFYEDRLVLGGTTTAPQRFDGSKNSDYENFAPTAVDGTVAADNAVSFTLSSGDINPIYWLANNARGLLAGTGGGEWVVKASALNEALSPTNISAKRSSRYGSAQVAPVIAGNTVLYIGRGQRKMRELAYVWEDDNFRSPDMTLLAEHITFPGVAKIVFQLLPQPIVWALMTDGTLRSFTYERDQNVTGWARHAIAGPGDASGGAAVVEDIAVTTAPDGINDEIWLTVKRYINGTTIRNVEVMTALWLSTNDQLTAFYMDCGGTVINGSPSATVTGAFWLEGQSVGVYVDGAAHPAVTVTNGTLTLLYAGSVVTWGYLYNSDGQTLPAPAASPDGSGQGKMKKIGRIGFWLMNTLGLKFGSDVNALDELIVSVWGDKYGSATPLQTGVIRERFAGNFDLTGQVYWRCNGPFPATVLSVMPQVTVSDDS